MREPQEKLIHILCLDLLDSGWEHHESKPAGYKARLLDQISDDQKSKLLWLCDQWRDREDTSDINCFRIGQKIRECFVTKGRENAQIAKGRKDVTQSNRKKGVLDSKIKCRYFHRNETSNPSSAECPVNSANALRKDAIIARLGQKGDRKSASSSKLTQLEAKLSTQEALVKVLAAKIKATPTAASAKEVISDIMATDDLNEKKKLYTD